MPPTSVERSEPGGPSVSDRVHIYWQTYTEPSFYAAALGAAYETWRNNPPEWGANFAITADWPPGYGRDIIAHTIAGFAAMPTTKIPGTVFPKSMGSGPAPATLSSILLSSPPIRDTKACLRFVRRDL